jgi:hypothetical protein
MSSVLAIVSKALFEKMVPKDVKLGAVVDTDAYVSGNKTFDALAKGGAIFLVTVRPPNEKLWLVGILEDPKKKGDTWKAAANEAPLTDVTSAIKKLEFTSGTGLKAKKGALGMSLQTPRGLTAADEKLLRGFVKSKPKASAKVHANEAYKEAVDAVVHKPKGKTTTGKFRLENVRKPFAGKLASLAPWEKQQLVAVVGKKTPLESFFGKKKKKQDDEDEFEASEMQVIDVVDNVSAARVYQLMIWPYGDGVVFHNETTKAITGICQHGLDPVEDIGKAWTRDFARAWVEGSKRLKLWSGHIDFSAEELGEDDDDE